MVDILNLFGANLLVTIILLAVSAIPLYFAVKMMGGDVGFLEAMIVVLIAGGIPIVMGLLFNNYLKLISFICIILIYMFFFKLGLWKAVLTWLIQYLIIFVLLLLFGGLKLGFMTLGSG